MITERSGSRRKHLEGEGETDQAPRRAGWLNMQLRKVWGRVQDVCEGSGLHCGMDATAQWSRRHDCSGLEGKGDLCVEHAQCAVLFGHLGEVTNQLVIQAAPLRGFLCL